MKPLFLVIVFATLVLAGCTTKSKARHQTQSAYFAGQQQAYAQVQEARRLNVRFVGYVLHPEVQWVEGLTLAQAIAIADYPDRRTPSEIVIVRQRGRFTVDPKSLLHGEDYPLEPGDTIEIHP